MIRKRKKRIQEKEYIKVISKRTKEKKSIIKLVLKQYTMICIKEMINGGQIIFPKNFGTAEIVTKPWTKTALEYSQEKGNSETHEYRVRTNFKPHNNEKYQMCMYGVGKLVITLKHVVINNLRKFRYVDQ